MAGNNNTDTTYDIVCPFCFKRYTNFRTLFADHRRYTEEVYPEYAEYLRYFMGIEAFGGRKMPLYFQKRGNDGIADPFSAATEDGDVTYTRVCPYCYNILPASSGKMKSFSITVIGASDAERSFYIASVLHRLNKDMTLNFGASFIPADLRTAQTFYDQYESPLYVDHTVPEAVAAIVPLTYEFSRTGVKEPETWLGSDVTFNRALLYIYNIDKDLCDRYPMIAYNVIAQASGIVFISDISDMTGNDDPVYEPWLGYLTETLRKIFGPTAIEVPTAVVLSNSDKAAVADKKWLPLVKAGLSHRIEKVFPLSYFEKLSAKIKATMKSEVPAYYSALEALFSQENTIYFTSKKRFELHEDGSADIGDSSLIEASFVWLMSKLNIIEDDSRKSFRIK